MHSRNDDQGEALRRIPSLDAFVRREPFAAWPRRVLLDVARSFLDEVRAEVMSGRMDARQVEVLFEGDAERRVARRCEAAMVRGHRRVINATGIVLHTGLGRAPLAEAAREAVADCCGYAVVEVDLDTGDRGRREDAVADLLRRLTGAGGALAVNNNAAAVNLALCVLARGREVVVSRGQLVEIGGGFRMPDVMAQAGCTMVEVGTTNRTHLRDYAGAAGERTAGMLIVHPSNFRIEGFTASPARAEIVDLARSRGLWVLEDVGSGLLVEEAVPGLEDEPRVRDCVEAGVDVVCFSGDKLLGGPQCGLLVGREDLLTRMRAHPLYRALRCDKLTLAALEATLRVYRDGDPLAEIPALRAIGASEAGLRERAEGLRDLLGEAAAGVVRSESFAGSGANPARPLRSWAVAVPGGRRTADALRGGPGVPVLARIARDEVLLDMRSLCDEDLEEVAREVARKLASG